MALLDGLKIGNAPSAFAEFAAKHNALVDLIASLEGSLGVDIKIVQPRIWRSADRKPKGKILIGLETAAIQTQAIQFPIYSNTANANVTLDENGFSIVVPNTNDSCSFISDGTNIHLKIRSNSAAKSLDVASNGVTQNLAIRTEQYCTANGNTANVLVIDSPSF